MKNVIVMLLGMLLLAAMPATATDAVTVVKVVDSSEIASVDTTIADEMSEQVIVYYLHSNRRCVTCKKLEAYSEEAVQAGFAEQLKDSSVVWRVVNFEDEGNEHYAKDYALYSQSVVLSKVQGGEEVAWKNLDKIWKLVGDKDEFTAYIQGELQSFIESADSE